MKSRKQNKTNTNACNKCGSKYKDYVDFKLKKVKTRINYPFGRKKIRENGKITRRVASKTVTSKICKCGGVIEKCQTNMD